MSAWRGYGYCLLVVVISLMAGCAAHGPAFKKITEIPTGKGVVYIYRSPGIVGSAVSYQVYVGNSSLGRLVPGGYLTYLANPGELELWGETESKGSVTLDVKPGQEHYLKGSLSFGFVVGRPLLMVVEPSVGRMEIEECKQNVE